jgi:hypothetical protein
MTEPPKKEEALMVCTVIRHMPVALVESIPDKCCGCGVDVWVAADRRTENRPALYNGELVVVDMPDGIQPHCSKCAIDKCLAEGDIDSAMQLTKLARSVGYLDDDGNLK